LERKESHREEGIATLYCAPWGVVSNEPRMGKQPRSGLKKERRRRKGESEGKKRTKEQNDSRFAVFFHENGDAERQSLRGLSEPKRETRTGGSSKLRRERL